MVGFFCGGLIVHYFNYTAAFITCGMLYFTGALLVHVFVKDGFSASKTTVAASGKTQKRPAVRIFTPVVLWILGLFLVMGVARRIDEPFLAMMVEAVNGKINEAFFTGLVSAVAALGGLLSGVVIGHFSDRVSPFKLLPPLLVVCMITMLLQAVCAGSLWLVCLILILAGGLPAVDRRHTFSPREFLPVLQKRSNLAIYLFFGLNFGLYYVLQTVIGKKFLQDFCNMGEMNAGWVFSATGALAASGGFIFAVLGQFMGARRYLFCRLAGVVSVLVFTVLTFMIAADMRNGMLCSLLILLLSCFASLTTVLIPILNESNPPSIIGRCMSILNFSCYIAVAMLGNMTGMILNCFSPATQDGSMACSRSAWLTLFVALTCCSLLVCFFSFRFGKTAAISHNPGHENAEKN
jgi:MFS family permease